eukprot:GHVS01027538.1.p1 GENE.GHVS01027538.1~~GHVS01027538.1.p1  ORF type:complete len:135 (-),score=21.12 GHVS01027538.1:99-503(-)
MEEVMPLLRTAVENRGNRFFPAFAVTTLKNKTYGKGLLCIISPLFEGWTGHKVKAAGMEDVVEVYDDVSPAFKSFLKGIEKAEEVDGSTYCTTSSWIYKVRYVATADEGKNQDEVETRLNRKVLVDFVLKKKNT